MTVEIEDFGVIIGFVGTLISSYRAILPLPKFAYYINLLDHHTKGGWCNKFVKFLKYIERDWYHTSRISILGLIFIIVGTIIILAY